MAGFSVQPMEVGAEITDLQPALHNDPHVRRCLYDAWLEHGFLVFRGIDSIERHLEVSRCFGELEIHPVEEVRSRRDPYLIEIGSPSDEPGRLPPVYLFDGKARINRIPWHRDTAYTPDICKGAMLRMVEAPKHEGETMIADTAMAWDDLPGDVQQKLVTLEYKATLRITHGNTLGRHGIFWAAAEIASEAEFPGNAERSARFAAVDDRFPSVVHPAVLTHPESGRKCVFISPTYADEFLGIGKAESDDLLSFVANHMLQPKYVYKHKWNIDDAVIWDNRRCLHAGKGNAPGEPRFGLRTTLAGSMRTGRYFDQNGWTENLVPIVD